MSTTVVAGGAGFIGSHLCRRLLEQGERVIALDSYVTGREANVAELRDHPRFTLLHHDIRDAAIQIDGTVDLVMNLASPASPVDFLTRSIEILETGSIGTRNLLDLALRHRARFFQASTSEIYGDPMVHPQPESYWGNVDPVGPRSCYDEAKRFGEALVSAYERTHGLEVRIARIFNTYGPRMRPDDGRVLTNFIMAALRNEPLELYGTGEQTRSFCFVEDEVEGLLALARSGIRGPVNVGNDSEITIREVAELIVQLTESSSTIRVVPMPAERLGDPVVRRPDLTRARNELGWTPRIDLLSGLRRMIEWIDGETGAMTGA